MTSEAAPRPSFGEATRLFARIGLLSFGGPAGQIALMHRYLVDEKRWIDEPRFLHALNYCMLLPGPEAQQLATYVGWLLHGTRGGLVAGTLFVLPGFLVMLALSTAYALWQSTALLQAVFFGLKAAVLVIVVEALIRIGRRALTSRAAYVTAALAFLGLFVFDLPFPLVVIAAGLAGFIAGSTASTDTPVVDKNQPGLGGALKVLAVGLILWFGPVLLFGLWQGWDSVYVGIGVFFAKMAVVTFGGAYAVLAYVAQQAVETLGWLRPGEMLDGLALAETTPGPLILVLTYVGYLAAFRAPGTLDPLTGAFAGAILTTWVTFVPCFIWIFLGAPYVERLRANRRLARALAFITAAVVGVILNLTVWFGLHVLFARTGTVQLGPLNMTLPDWATLDPAALLLTAIAALASFRFKLGLVPVLILTAGLGAAWRLLV